MLFEQQTVYGDDLMMKSVSAICFTLLLMLNLIGCASSVPKDSSLLPEVQYGPDFHASIADFASSATSNIYFIPTKVPDGFTFSQIKEREDVYVTVTYTAQGDAVSTGSSTYATERLNSLICQYSISNDPQIPLNQLTQYVGYNQTVTYNNKTYNMMLDVDPSAPETIVGYDLAFIDSGQLILLHLPAIDTLDNMMQYAEVIMVSLD